MYLSDLKHLQEIGTEIPEKLPATFIDCDSIDEAAELVLVYSSAYAKITQQGMFDFVSKFNLDVPSLRDRINIPEFSMERFEQKFDLFDVQNGEEPEVEIDINNLIVSPGDIFQLNGHRIICGSFTNEEQVEELMQGEKARIVNCDPPYNLPANFFTNKDEKRHTDFAMGAGEMTDEEFCEFLSLIMKRSIDNSVPGAIHYIFMDFRHSWHMTEAARRTYGNPQPKPVVMIADSILDTTNYGDIVIDWFLGSGTCLIACEHTGRNGRFTEIEPKYVQSAIQRYLNYCEKKGISVNFTHLNGGLTLNNFENVKLQTTH